MGDLLEILAKIFLYPPAILQKAADALNGYVWDKTLLNDYLGYMAYAMGSPMFQLFAAFALIAIAAALWSIIMKAAALVMEIIPFL